MRKIDFSQIENNGEIDWDQPQALVHISGGLVVVSTGHHDESCDTFNGYAFPCEAYPKGSVSYAWAKKSFIKLQGKINYVITNEE